MKENRPLIFSMFGSDHFVHELAKDLKLDKVFLIQRRFPDGESYLRYETMPQGRKVVIVDTLDHPDEKILPLVFAGETAKELGATEVGLIAPYLAYMRQDTRFHPGEAVTSTCFARLISKTFDWMITVDPHLHRHHSLSEIYSIPTEVVSATGALASWVSSIPEKVVLIGPDEESRQWVSRIAQATGAPFTILHKTRLGDHDVKISIPDLEGYLSHTPVLVDDIVSTGQTMIETLHHLQSLKVKPPLCLVVHPVFAGITTQTLINAGARSVISCNTISHNSNGLDLSPCLAKALKAFL